jgi:hypothetical protein
MEPEDQEMGEPAQADVPPGMRMTYPRWKVRLIGLFGWLAVIAVWYLGIRQGLSNMADSLLLILAIVVAVSAVIFSWVFHNKHLAHRREARYGGRKGAPDRPLVLEYDALGRKIELDPGSHDARLLEVSVSGDLKRIEPSGEIAVE